MLMGALLFPMDQVWGLSLIVIRCSAMLSYTKSWALTRMTVIRGVQIGIASGQKLAGPSQVFDV